MNLPRTLRTGLLLCGGIIAVNSLPGCTQPAADTNPPQALAAPDGQHDFDFEFGAWAVHISRLQHPLTGSTSWVEYDGTSIVRKIWGGRANQKGFEVDGPGGHLEGSSTCGSTIRNPGNGPSAGPTARMAASATRR